MAKLAAKKIIAEKGIGGNTTAKELCAKIRAYRRCNALEYAKDQPKRLSDLEKEIDENKNMKDVEKIRMRLEIEKIRQTEITSSLPTEQSIKLDDERTAQNSRQLMKDKLIQEEI